MADANQDVVAAIEPLAGKGYVVAVDLGGTKILAAVVDSNGRIVARAKKKSGGKGRDPGPVLDRIAECVREAASEAGIAVDVIQAIGIGVPGPVAYETGVVAVAVNLGWHDVPVRAELERRLGRRVAVENDVRLAVLAEHVAGAGKGADNLIGVWPGTGIGGGVIVDGKIVTGFTNSAGEIGHMTVKAGGPVCACGARGHLEALASRTAIVRWIAKQVERGESSALTNLVGSDLTRAASGDLVEALRQGDKLTAAAIERSTKYLAIGIASLANLLNPEVVVIGGGLAEAIGQPFVDQIIRQLKGRPMQASTDPLRVVKSALGDDAGIVGAAYVARRLAAGQVPQSGKPDGEIPTGFGGRFERGELLIAPQTMLNVEQERASDAVFATSSWEIGHVRHVRRLAVALFDSLRQLHGLGDPTVELLEAAALLHDVGYPIDPPNHHKVSARIIRSMLGAPFSADDVAMIALLARYHRKGGPKARHRRFSQLDDRQRRTVSWLAGILRVADGLDREHQSAVRWITSAVVHDRLTIYVSDDPDRVDSQATSATPSGALIAGVAGGSRKRDVLEHASGLPVVILTR